MFGEESLAGFPHTKSREYTDLSQVWHNAIEEPEHGKYILIEVVSTIQVRYFVEYVEKWVVNLMKIEGFKCRWTYVTDLLPKEVKNEKD